jgi:hypothetical protein
VTHDLKTWPSQIVAEVAKTWSGERVAGDETISRMFERVIRVNAERGYRLHSWRMTSVAPSRKLITETIVAVFESESGS